MGYINMKKFNKDKYLKKLRFKKYKRYLYIGIPCILVLLIGIYFAYSKFSVFKEEEVVRTTVGDFIYGDIVVGAYIDGEYSKTIPGKNDGYVVEKIVCDNDASASWDNDSWGIMVTNLTKRTKCNVYFKIAPIKKIIAQLDTSGKCPSINSDGTVNVTEIEANDGYVCSASDAYGTSYYYRGNVTNNYVKFGKWADDTPTVVYGYYSETSDRYIEYDSMETCQNASSYNTNCTVAKEKNAPMYWRIIRINGDGTVRVIYDGISAHANGKSSTDRQIGTSEFNLYWKKDNVQESTNSYIYYDNAGVGYMYGNRDGIVEPSTQYPTYSTSSYINTSTYYIAKEYTYNSSTDRFTLKNPIAVLGSAMTSDYVGYYTFNRQNSSSSNNYVYKITSVTAGSSWASVGYKYVTYGTTSKEQAQTNTNDSTIKTYLDNWYQTNISGTENEQYLADNIFCNDRSISTGTPSGYSNFGYGTEQTPYRWNYFANSSYNNKMKLICLQKNDAFTVSDTTNGNGALTYPVGLLSTDEIVLAGGWNADNKGYYLYSGQVWWASSPGYFIGDSAYVRFIGPNGDASYNGSGSIERAYGVRPVLNLSAEVLNNGDGSMDNPYHP